MAHNADYPVPKGFKLTKEFGRGHEQKIYQKGTVFITKDVGQKSGITHNGGVWKVMKRVGNKLKRTGTADENLKIFKD